MVFALGLAVVSSAILPRVYQARRVENEANAKEVLAMMKSSSRHLFEVQSPILMQRFLLAPSGGTYPLLPFLKTNSSGTTQYGGFEFQVFMENQNWVATAIPTLWNYSGDAAWKLNLRDDGFLAAQYNPE